jgi:hypothetical protein
MANLLEQNTRAGLTARILLSLASDHVAAEALMERKGVMIRTLCAQYGVRVPTADELDVD